MSLAVNHLIGFAARTAAAAGRTLGTQITAGTTKLGDMTIGGGLAAAFDGNTAQTGGASAAKNSANGWCGYTLTTSKRIYQVVTYGGTDAGYDGGGLNSITLTLYGKTGTAPASATDGTSLGATTFTNSNATNQKTIVSSDNETVWDHVWVRVAGSAANPRLCEAQVFESV